MIPLPMVDQAKEHGPTILVVAITVTATQFFSDWFGIGASQATTSSELATLRADIARVETEVVNLRQSLPTLTAQNAALITDLKARVTRLEDLRDAYIAEP